MARPVDTEKRHALAQAAVEVLREEGLDIPMSRLAERLNIKRPTLLYHFPDKASIAAVALEDLLTAQADHVLPCMAAHEHPLDQLHALLRAIHEFHRGREDLLLFLAQALASTSRERAAELFQQGDYVFAKEWAALAQRIALGIRRGTVRPCDPQALVQTVRSINDGLFLQRATSQVDPEPIFTFLWEHVLLPLKPVGPHHDQA